MYPSILKNYLRMKNLNLFKEAKNEDPKIKINLDLYKIAKKLNSSELSFPKGKLPSLLKVMSNEKISIKSYKKEINQIFQNKSSKKIKLQKEFIDETVDRKKDTELLRIALNILITKEKVMKNISELNKLHEEFLNSCHVLSYEYDELSSSSPYERRIAGSVLFKKIIDEIKLQKKSEKKFPAIDINLVGQIILAESINQGIRSSAGSSYEKRCEHLFQNSNLTFSGKKHDKNGFEYDFIIKRKKLLIGVSAKRTWRERWKETFFPISDLEVDEMFLVTLGIDLTESRTKQATKEKGYKVFVADDIYKKTPYLQSTEGAFSIKDLETVVGS